MVTRKTITADGVYDIETSNWTTFVVGAILDRTGFYPYTWRRESDMFDSLVKRKGVYWAHNGGRYDALWFLGHIRSARQRAICYGQGQRITSAKIGKLTLCDSYALVPMSLKKGARLGQYQKIETGLPCSCEKDCGGYCSISRSMPPNLMRRLIEYLEYDCKATLSMLDALIEYTAENDLDLCPTIGSSSWNTARRTLGIDAADWQWGERGQSEATLYSFARGGYYGGRTQVFRPEAEHGYRYDINSSYPAALANTALPTGEPSELYNGDAMRAYLRGREGLYRAHIRVPECHIPPLPLRGELRLSYPTGDICGLYAATELRYAEEMGCRIQRVDAGLVWSNSDIVFGPFLRRIWSLRDKAGPKTALGTWLKWFANSLTGRLAIRPEGETIIVGEIDAAKPCPAGLDGGDCTFTECTKRCGVTLPLAEWGQGYGIYVKHKWQISDSAYVHWAAYLTAVARINLHRQLVGDGCDGQSTVYCDTDSCICIVERTDNIGDGLGQFKREGEFWDWRCLAPKTYEYIDENGEIHAASKGVEDAARNFGPLSRGERIDMNRGVKSIRSAIKSDDSFFVRKTLSRSILSTVDDDGVKWYGDRYLVGDMTHPVRL